MILSPSITRSSIYHHRLTSTMTSLRVQSATIPGYLTKSPVKVVQMGTGVLIVDEEQMEELDIVRYEKDHDIGDN